MRRIRGFTLIELMVVIAVVAILAAIAIPAFTQQIRKSRRAEAMHGLSELQLKQERWRASNATYAADMTTLLGSSAAATGYNNGNPFYTFSVLATPATDAACTCTAGSCFQLKAAAKGVQVSDTACADMRLTNKCGTISKTPTTDRCWN